MHLHRAIVAAPRCTAPQDGKAARVDVLDRWWWEPIPTKAVTNALGVDMVLLEEPANPRVLEEARCEFAKPLARW